MSDLLKNIREATNAAKKAQEDQANKAKIKMNEDIQHAIAVGKQDAANEISLIEHKLNQAAASAQNKYVIGVNGGYKRIPRNAYDYNQAYAQEIAQQFAAKSFKTAARPSDQGAWEVVIDWS